ncbi:MAG: hypothetical protein M3033_18870 [Acidobacteriota bacterium]|nr:hypothetical protein [Acidobacteriota bacterium]
MKVSVCLLVIISGFFSIACSKSDKTESNAQAEIDKIYKTKPNGEIIFDDNSSGQNGAASRASSQQTTQLASDGSQVTTMYDGHGNKTEMRFFDSDPILQSVMVRTSARGERQVSVYGQNGLVRALPDNMLDKAMSASASALASAAGISEGRRETPKPMSVQNNQPPLQPLPSSNFPVQKPQIQTTPAQTPPPATIETPKAQTEVPAVSTKKPESPVSKNQPE